MKTLSNLLILVVLVLFNTNTFADDHPQLKAFPAAKEGITRFVIVLPDKDRTEESQFKVELFVGKEMLTDGVNMVRLNNSIEAKPLPGWGYTFYEVTGSGDMISTLMAPPDNAPKVKKWVAGSPNLIDYNSRLPIVIYAPNGYDIKYRIWQAPKEMLSAEKG